MEGIVIKGLEREQGDFKLKIENLEIKKGYITGFIGKNGAGKTTTIKSIMGMLNINKGQVLVLGEDAKNKKIKEKIGYIGDRSGYLEESLVKNLKKTISRFYPKWDESLYRELMMKFNINENKRYNELSKGQKKLFELTMALSYHPEILIMDEPTANLDPVIRDEFLEIIQDVISRDELTVFYSTHITSDLEKAADYIVMINNGEIILNGEREELLEKYYIVKGKKNLLREENKKSFVSVKENTFGFQGLTHNKQEVLSIFGNEVVYDKANLEDILLFYSKGEV